eukprot:2539731-Amphidinium_carterae.1
MTTWITAQTLQIGTTDGLKSRMRTTRSMDYFKTMNLEKTTTTGSTSSQNLQKSSTTYTTGD